MIDQTEYETMKREIHALRVSNAAIQASIDKLIEAIDQVAAAPAAAFIAFAHVMEHHGIARALIISEMDRVMTAVHPNAESAGGVLGAEIVAGLQGPAWLQKP